ncbi:peptidase S8/S53 domain-containing protein [Podospora australis]|uniref:Peptidase S8/S53 domain-containing protein n=1 Tax=Podospora australis TaxID=1536484 RepID=A0AAN7AIL9_9PEZI|nr:peptidase S8/S53 domain-containing protein [Podospora australis]
MADSHPSAVSTVVNGHTVPLFNFDGDRVPRNAEHTDWVIIQFDRFVDYASKQQLQQERNLEVYDNLGNNAYLCKYTPAHLGPVLEHPAVTHLSLYADHVVPMSSIEGLPLEIHATTPQSYSILSHPSGETKKPYILELHPSPKETPAQVLERVRNSFGAEHINDENIGNTIRVNIAPAALQQVAAIDSIRSIASIHPRVPYAVRPTGHYTMLRNLDTGFDKGVADDVHPAFAGRVLAVTVSKGVDHSADWDGHGTHVAGSILGDFRHPSGSDMFSVCGTAPEARLISIAIFPTGFGPTTFALLTQDLPYGPDDALAVDEVMHPNSDACLVFAAGNDGCYRNQNDKQQQIGDYSAAKNCITVERSCRRACRKLCKTTVILNLKDTLFMDGTSQATPAVTGFVAVLRGAYRKHHGRSGAKPSGALLKGLMIHGAVDLVGTNFTVIARKYRDNKAPQTSKTYTMTKAPNPFQGYGRVDINNSLIPVTVASPTGDVRGRGSIDSTRPSGFQQKAHPLSSSGTTQTFVVTLAYTDPPGCGLAEFDCAVCGSIGRVQTHPVAPNRSRGQADRLDTVECVQNRRAEA